jgi:hypothetical protein
VHLRQCRFRPLLLLLPRPLPLRPRRLSRPEPRVLSECETNVTPSCRAPSLFRFCSLLVGMYSFLLGPYALRHCIVLNFSLGTRSLCAILLMTSTLFIFLFDTSFVLSLFCRLHAHAVFSVRDHAVSRIHISITRCINLARKLIDQK